ncbi:hypothetical protein AB0G04_42850 [Actinoplanes sp. NPDC023801]|uniref:hypothetical protein n=1 Tax=Actinoplanes sp. NPDC023801 TaxID=3154595 RepID=UPI0033C67F67
MKPKRTDPVDEKLTIGPDGFGKVKLGMSVAEAYRTGQLDGPAPKKLDDCELGVPLFRGGTIRAAVTLSPRIGVGTIVAYSNVFTPEGIALGSTLDEVVAAYPGWDSLEIGDPDDHRQAVKVAGRKDTYYDIEVVDGEVVALRLYLIETCYA